MYDVQVTEIIETGKVRSLEGRRVSSVDLQRHRKRYDRYDVELVLGSARGF